MSGSISMLRAEQREVRGTRVARFVPGEVWERYRHKIQGLYLGKEPMSLNDLKERMREDHNFEASTKQWKSQLAKWNFRKNVSRLDAAIMLRLYADVDDTEVVRLVYYQNTHKSRDQMLSYITKHSDIKSEAQLLSEISHLTETPPYITWTDHPRNKASRMSPVLGTPERATSPAPSTRTANVVDIHEDHDFDSFLSTTPFLSAVAVPPKPLFETADPSQREVKDVMKVSLLLALAMSLNRRGSFLSGHLLWPGSPIDGSRPDPDLLRTCTDLVSQLRLRIDTVLLAIMYMGSKAPTRPSALTYGPWPSTLACLRIADELLDDRPLAPKTWKQAAEMMAEPWEQVIHSECETLSESIPSRLILHTRWGVVTERAEHITSSLFRAIDVAFSNPGVDTESSQADWQWMKHKGEICELYRTRKLEDVMAVMKQKHGFAPSTRGYRQRIADWGIKKKPSQLLHEGGENDVEDEVFISAWHPTLTPAD